MSLFDRLKSLVGARLGPAVSLRGPLDLAPGDGVGWYQDEFLVAGVRRVVHDGQEVWHYCLQSQEGRAVLVVEPGPTPTLWLQRPVQAELPWDRDTIEGFSDEPFRLASRGQAAVDSTGDTGTPPVRAVAFREYEDAAAERSIVLEDWGGVRETRVGETILDAELRIHRAADSAPPEDDPRDLAAPDAEAVRSDRRVRGTPMSAAALLDGGADDAATAEGPVPDAVIADDVDPNEFGDERWDDEADATATSHAFGEIEVESEESEWTVATRWIREHGLPADDRAAPRV